MEKAATPSVPAVRSNAILCEIVKTEIPNSDKKLGKPMTIMAANNFLLNEKRMSFKLFVFLKSGWTVRAFLRMKQ